MTDRIRFFLAIQIAVFASAALVHFGVAANGYEDTGAGIAESVIAVVLLGGLVMSWRRPEMTRDAGLAVQTFGLLGTCVGISLLILVGPRTALEITYHIAMFVLLALGLFVTLRSPVEDNRQRA